MSRLAPMDEIKCYILKWGKIHFNIFYACHGLMVTSLTITEQMWHDNWICRSYFLTKVGAVRHAWKIKNKLTVNHTAKETQMSAYRWHYWKHEQSAGVKMVNWEARVHLKQMENKATLICI